MVKPHFLSYHCYHMTHILGAYSLETPTAWLFSPKNWAFYENGKCSCVFVQKVVKQPEDQRPDFNLACLKKSETNFCLTTLMDLNFQIFGLILRCQPAFQEGATSG